MALVFSVGQIVAAPSDEDRAYGVAMDKFHAHLWDSAEKDFADFVQKYPNSVHVAEAVLMIEGSLCDMHSLTHHNPVDKEHDATPQHMCV